MSSSKPCRNCGATEFYYSDVSARGSYGPDLLPIGGFFSKPTLVMRVCGRCGIVDWFVPDKHLVQVRQRFSQNAEDRPSD
jgi:hypothetical protein